MHELIKKTLKKFPFSVLGIKLQAIYHESYVVLSRTIIEYHNQNHLSSIFFKAQKKNIEEILLCFFAHDVIEPYPP